MVTSLFAQRLKALAQLWLVNLAGDSTATVCEKQLIVKHVSFDQL